MSKRIKNILDSKFECYILIGEEKEFKWEEELYIKAYSTNIYDLLKNAFKQYSPLKQIAEEVLKELNNE